MAVRLISFPFRIGGTGAIASVEQDGDAYVEERIAVALLTRPGERIQVPTFGTADPAFAGFETAALQRHLVDFGPAVRVTGTAVTYDQNGDERVTVEWERRRADASGTPLGGGA
jgi:hypothetical protein